MGQTLTHGIYLPDEGERNCYNGLAGNWTILDGAVGTIAEHTTALSGKAPLVHTHTVSQITDFPAYGNAAGTICEGNDSRLSDARTPVAHTHGKADITDLFNSANVWTNTNTFQQNITYERTNFFHRSNNPCYFLTDTGLEKGSLASTTHSAYAGNWQDKNNANLGYMRFVEYDTGKQTAEIRVSNLIKNGALDPTGSTVNCTVNLELQPSGEKSLIPEQNNDINLGTSTNKWKSLNGVNPGALSLPSDSSSVSIDTTNWNVSGGFGNSYTPASNGWLHINIKDSATNSIFVYASNKYAASIYGNGSQGLDGRLALMIPVLSGVTYGIIIKAGSVSEIYTAKFIPCQGNV